MWSFNKNKETVFNVGQSHYDWHLIHLIWTGHELTLCQTNMKKCETSGLPPLLHRRKIPRLKETQNNSKCISVFFLLLSLCGQSVSLCSHYGSCCSQLVSLWSHSFLFVVILSLFAGCRLNFQQELLTVTSNVDSWPRGLGLFLVGPFSNPPMPTKVGCVTPLLFRFPTQMPHYFLHWQWMLAVDINSALQNHPVWGYA